jgi:hypothetical protein
MLGREDRSGLVLTVSETSLWAACPSVCAMLIDRPGEAIILDLPLLDRWSK